MTGRRILAALLVLLLWGTSVVPGALAQAPPPGPAEPPGATIPPDRPPQGVDATPPRVGFVSGEVSFWRPGAADWAPARVNTPLAPGDLLYTGNGGNVEVQIGSRAFVRAAPGTQVGLENLEPDFIQFKVTSGHFSLDLRDLAVGSTVELDTPNAVFTVERTGYYRVSVGESATAFITRRGGRATVTPAGGTPVTITPSEHVVVTGADSPQVETYVAPELSDWDRWNYARTDYLLEAMSARYVPSGVYGARDLDRYGNWRVTQEYGTVWVPDSTPPGWAPYSTGRWMWDPFYGWTWVDDAPWGWAPYHYGRWVFASGFWAWAPGPIVVRPFYAPALVAFFGGPVVARPLAWVALGWGEPCIPWWGPRGFVGTAWWGGWGGPRVVNNVVINKTTIVNVKNVTVYRNAGVANAVVAMPSERFGREPVTAARITKMDMQGLAPVHGPVPVRPAQASLVPATGASARPPESVYRRPVVATRAPRDVVTATRAEGLTESPGMVSAPAPRLVAPPSRAGASAPPERPPFGKQTAPERSRPPEPPRLEGATRTAPSRAERRPAPAASEGTVPAARPPRRGERPPAVAPPAGPVQAPSAQASPAARTEGRGTPTPSTPRTQPRVQAPPASGPQTPRVPAPVGEAPRAQAPPAPRTQTPAAPAAPSRAQAPQGRTTPPVRAEGIERQKRPLPGEPANRLFPGQGERRAERQPERQPPRQQPEKQPRAAEPQTPGGGGDGAGQRGGGRN